MEECHIGETTAATAGEEACAGAAGDGDVVGVEVAEELERIYESTIVTKPIIWLSRQSTIRKLQLIVAHPDQLQLARMCSGRPRNRDKA